MKGPHSSGGVIGLKFVGGVEGSWSGEEMRTLSAKVSERLFAVEGFGAVLGAGVANGLALLSFVPACDENGLAFAEMLPVSVPAPNRLAPKSCLGGAGVDS